MENPLVKEIRPGTGWFRQLTASDIRKLFGLAVTASLPNEYVRRQYVGPGGPVQLRIVPKDDPLVNRSNNRAHRVFAECPHCLRWIPFGRMQQHVHRADHQDAK